MRRCLAMLALLSTASPVSALPVPPASAVTKRTLMESLVHLTGNRPVPVVVVASGPPLTDQLVGPNTEGLSLKDALTAIARVADGPMIQTYGVARPDYAAVQIDGVWTLTYDHIWVTRLPAVRPATVDVYAQTMPDTLVEWALKSLTASQLAQATGAGIPFADLAEEQRRLLEAAFRSPFTLMKESAGAHGELNAANVTAPAQPLSIEASTLHLYSVFGPVEYTLDDKSTRDARFRRKGAIIAFPNDAFPGPKASAARVWHEEQAPNLDYGAPSLKQRIGLSGVRGVEVVVAAAAKSTGLSLMVDRRWKDAKVFVGDASMPTGNVLRVIAYGLNGSWRRIGCSWLLTRDQIGREQRRIRWKEAGAPLRMAQDSLKRSAIRPEWFADAIDQLRPEPGLNLGPTQDQIETLRKRWKSLSTNSERMQRMLRFADLNVDQRTAILNITTDNQFLDAQANALKPVPKDLIELGGFPTIDAVAYLDVPGIGRLRLEIAPPWIASAWDGPGVRPTPAPPPAVTSPESISLKPAVSALAIAPLPRGQWPELFRQMRAKGITLLYVPVLWDGQTLHSSRYFPQLAMAGGGDMLADLLRQAKANGIRVIGVVNALTWRLPGGPNDHWLAKRRDLVDVDALGRSRREWRLGPAGADSPESNYSFDFASVVMDTNLLADFVTSRSGEVRARLLGLVRELRRYPGLSGIALRHWTAVTEERSVQNWAPPLGYTETARVSFLRAHDVDPVDLDEGSPDDSLFQIMEENDTERLTIEWESVRLKADVNLANTLLGAMRKGWPGHVHLFVQLDQYRHWNRSETMVELPSGDINIPGKAPGFGGYVDTGYAWRPAPGPLTVRGRSPQSQSDRLAVFAESLKLIGTVFIASDQPSYPGAVLDFTAAPDLLLEGLTLLKSVNSPG